MTYNLINNCFKYLLKTMQSIYHKKLHLSIFLCENEYNYAFTFSLNKKNLNKIFSF
jgi:hypothetical protein